MNYTSQKSLTYNPSLTRNIGNKALTIASALFAIISVLPLILVISYVLIKGGSYINLDTLMIMCYIYLSNITSTLRLLFLPSALWFVALGDKNPIPSKETRSDLMSNFEISRFATASALSSASRQFPLPRIALPRPHRNSCWNKGPRWCDRLF